MFFFFEGLILFSLFKNKSKPPFFRVLFILSVISHFFFVDFDWMKFKSCCAKSDCLWKPRESIIKLRAGDFGIELVVWAMTRNPPPKYIPSEFPQKTKHLAEIEKHRFPVVFENAVVKVPMTLTCWIFFAPRAPVFYWWMKDSCFERPKKGQFSGFSGTKIGFTFFLKQVFRWIFFPLGLFRSTYMPFLRLFINHWYFSLGCRNLILVVHFLPQNIWYFKALVKIMRIFPYTSFTKKKHMHLLDLPPKPRCWLVTTRILTFLASGIPTEIFTTGLLRLLAGFWGVG